MSESIEGEVIEATGTELELAPARNLLGVTDPVAVIAEAERIAGAMRDTFRANGMIQKIGSSEHILLPGLQTAGAMTGVDVVVEWTRPLSNGWEARAVAQRTIDGRVVGAAEAMCTRDERNWARRDDFALRSMAQTRAMSRALRAPLGFLLALTGASATAPEELDTAAAPLVVPPTVLPGWAKPVGDVGPAAIAIAAILKAGGVPAPADRTVEVGKRVRDRCDGGFPNCVSDALEHIRELVEAA